MSGLSYHSTGKCMPDGGVDIARFVERGMANIISIYTSSYCSGNSGLILPLRRSASPELSLRDWSDPGYKYA